VATMAAVIAADTVVEEQETRAAVEVAPRTG
jgi:hypothetical protein